MPTRGDATLSGIWRLWMPLEAAWLLMAAEGPFVAAVLARLAEPTLNLAAFGVAFAFAMLFESPIILIMSASTALVEDRDSYLKLQRFTFALNAIITLALALFLLEPVFHGVTGALMGLPSGVVDLAHPACALLLPWPSAIGYRRFYQGILVRNNLTRRVAYGTSIRLSAMGGVALLLALGTPLPGALVGTAALSAGVVMEALASRYWARETVRKLLGTENVRREPLTYAAIRRFYLPLALTSILSLGVNPLVSFFLGRSRMPLESLAVMPVVNSLVFVFNTAGLTYQEVAITLAGAGAETHRHLKRFALILAGSTSGALFLLALSPLLGLWLVHVAGLTRDLAAFAVLPVTLMTLQPALTVALGFQRALLVTVRTTRPISWATGIEVAGIALVLLLLTQGAGWVGAVAAACAVVVGRALAALYLVPKTLRRKAGAFLEHG